jgi:hypothetical protein
MHCSVLYLTLFVLFVECICPSHAGEVSHSTCSHVKLIWLIQIMSLFKFILFGDVSQYVTSGGSDHLTHHSQETGKPWPTGNRSPTTQRTAIHSTHDHPTSSITTIPLQASRSSQFSITIITLQASRPSLADQPTRIRSTLTIFLRVNCISNNTVEVIKRNRKWKKFNDKFNRNGKETIQMLNVPMCISMSVMCSFWILGLRDVIQRSGEWCNEALLRTADDAATWRRPAPVIL